MAQNGARGTETRAYKRRNECYDKTEPNKIKKS